MILFYLDNFRTMFVYNYVIKGSKGIIDACLHAVISTTMINNYNMPKLNTNNPAVRKCFIDICANWVENYHIDGLRLDVAHEVSHRFCKELRARLKEINPDIYILGEIWHNAIPWLRGDEFDAVMNYPLDSHDTKRLRSDIKNLDQYFAQLAVLFERHCIDTTLLTNGILIRKIVGNGDK